MAKKIAKTSKTRSARTEFKKSQTPPAPAEEKKYEILKGKKHRFVGYDEGRTILHRIRALRNIPRYGVQKGDIGGFVQSESNLSQKGDSWIGDDAKVYAGASVYEDAIAYENAIMGDNSRACGTARIHGDVEMMGRAQAWDRAHVHERAKMDGEVKIFEDAELRGEAWMTHAARVSGRVVLGGKILVGGFSELCGDMSLDAGIIKETWQPEAHPFRRHRRPLERDNPVSAPAPAKS